MINITCYYLINKVIIFIIKINFLYFYVFYIALNTIILFLRIQFSAKWMSIRWISSLKLEISSLGCCYNLGVLSIKFQSTLTRCKSVVLRTSDADWN
jgi:hypothetical protein